MTTKRDQALAQLAQQLEVPPHLLNLYPPAANHWTAVADALQDWRDAAWRHYDRFLLDMLAAAPLLSGGWREVLYGDLSEPRAELAASCYKVPCPSWPRDLSEPDPCSIGDCLTCPGSAVGCGCGCHYREDGWLD